MAAVCETTLRAGEMYGYLPGELIGQPVESLVLDGLQAAHVSQRGGYAGHPTACPAIRITKISEAVYFQDAVSECRRRQGAASLAPITERDCLGRPGERLVRAERRIMRWRRWQVADGPTGAEWSFRRGFTGRGRAPPGRLGPPRSGAPVRP